MAIQKRFIHFKKFSDFNSKKLSANETNTLYTVGVSGEIQNGEPDILYQSYCWIKDTKQQWTHGQVYDGSSGTYTTEFTVFDLFSISEDSPLTINKEALVNAVLSDKIIIIPYQDNKGSYVVSVDAFDEEIYFNLHFHDNSLSFVIYPNTSNNEITVDDLFTVFLQEALTSGENIRTINGESIIGDGSDLELATKEELNEKADDSSVVHTEGDETIRGTKTFYAGPKFLSSGDANAIKFGTDTRINVDNLDGTTNTILGFIRQQFIVNSQSYPLYLNGQQERPKYNNFEELALLSDVNNAVNNINQTIEENEEVVAGALNDLNTRLNELGDPSIIPITWAELKDIRDNSLLKPGQQYRITDYVTTTIEGSTRSAGHQFDIVVIADDVNVLNENARAIQHEGDTYFANSNLASWEIKYCLDNNTEKFTWADSEPINYITKIIGWYENDPNTDSARIYQNDDDDTIYDWESLVHPDTGESTIVIYAQNPLYFEEMGCDYADAHFYNGIVTVDGIEYDSWKCYDFNQDDWVNLDSAGKYILTERIVFNNEVITPEHNKGENGRGVIYYMKDEFNNECPYDFKNIQFGIQDSYVYTFSMLNSDEEVIDASLNTKAKSTESIVANNIIKPRILLRWDESDRCEGLKQILNFITFSTDRLYIDVLNNTFDYNCEDIHIKGSGRGNVFGPECGRISLGTGCDNNYFGGDCAEIHMSNNCYKNKIDFGCASIRIGSLCYSNKFGVSCSGIALGNNCSYNTFMDNCTNVVFKLSSSGNITYHNKGDYTNLDYCINNIVDTGCHYVAIWNNEQPTRDNPLQHLHISKVTSNYYEDFNNVQITNYNIEHELKVAKNSNGEIKVYCEADLIA